MGRDLYLKVSCTVNMDYLWLHFGNTRIKLVFGVTHKILSFIYFSYIYKYAQTIGHNMSSGLVGPNSLSTLAIPQSVCWVSTESGQLHGSIKSLRYMKKNKNFETLPTQPSDLLTRNDSCSTLALLLWLEAVVWAFKSGLFTKASCNTSIQLLARWCWIKKSTSTC